MILLAPTARTLIHIRDGRRLKADSQIQLLLCG